MENTTKSGKVSIWAKIGLCAFIVAFGIYLIARVWGTFNLMPNNDMGVTMQGQTASSEQVKTFDLPAGTVYSAVVHAFGSNCVYHQSGGQDIPLNGTQYIQGTVPDSGQTVIDVFCIAPDHQTRDTVVVINAISGTSTDPWMNQTALK